MSERFDVVAVNIATGAERLMATDLAERDAEAVVKMAVMRRGVEEEIFKMVPAGGFPTDRSEEE